jgi:hypothetical protein
MPKEALWHVSAGTVTRHEERLLQEDEEESCRKCTQLVRIAFALFRQTKCNADDDPACRAGGSRANHDAPSTITLDDKPCQKAEDQVVDRSGCRQDAGDELVEIYSVDEDVSLKVARHIYAAFVLSAYPTTSCDVKHTNLIHSLHPST